MKKSLFLGLVAIFGLIGCSRNQEIDVPDANLSLIAKTESSTDSRTVVEGEVHVYWEPGDEIAVFMGEQSAKFTTDITAASGTATFKGTFGDATWPEELDLWAVYPFSEDAAFDGETITTTLPSEQVAREGSFGKDMNLAIAHSNSSTLQFYNVGGGIRFSVLEEGIKKVMFEGLGEETLAGQIKISIQNGVPTYIEGSGMRPYIALSAPGEGFVPGEWYYMNALPQNLSKGFQIRFFKDGSSGVRVFEKSVEIKRGIFGTVANADTGVEFYQDEMVQVDDDAIEDLINQCIGSEVDVETKREELEALPSVESVEILEMETIVHFVSGEVVYYPYAFPSIFDQEDIAGAAPAPKKTKSKKKAPAKASGYVAADVAIFNLFSEDSGRKNQNKLVENTKAVFERAGKSVHIYGRDDFNIDNLVEAIKSNAIIFVSTLGTKDSKILLGQKVTVIPETSYDNLMYINNLNAKKFDGSQRYTTDIVQILNDKHYSGPLVYLASCYTKPNNNSSLNLVGWNGINKVGQAYGLIIADYLANWGKTFQAFSIDFSNDHTPSGTIIDPLETETKLIHYGNGWSGSSRDGWTELKYDNKVVIDQPTPGTCNKKLKYTLKLSYRNDGSIVTDGKSVTYENGNKYYFEYTDLGDILRRSDPLRFKDDIVEYKVKNLTPGVWRFQSYPTADDAYYGNSRYFDYTYAIFSHSFKENDVQEDDTPSVVTLGTLAGTNDLVLGGAVVNRSLAGLETGFEYWKKNAPTNKSTIATSTTYEDYFGAVLQIPDLDGEYEFRAFAKDEEGLTGYGDIQSFKYGGGPQQEYAVPEIIDLGLPSGVKWASFNLGATKPEESGYIFAWGETEPANDYSYWDSYLWCNGSNNSLTKYCDNADYGYNGFVDCKIILDEEDDAAFSKLKDKWRLPTIDEFHELRENCTWTWETKNGVNGCTVTSTINGQSIFIPATFESGGNYWSSNVNYGWSFYPYYAKYFQFMDSGPSSSTWVTNRCAGLHIRPVYGDPITHVESITINKQSMRVPVGVTVSELEVTVLPESATYKDVFWFSSDDTVASINLFDGWFKGIKEGTASVIARVSDGGQTAVCNVVFFGPSSLITEPEIVDLGLSVKWASFNVGATTPEDIGNYYAWGETEPKNDYRWDNYKWCNGSNSTLTKYCYNEGYGYNGFMDNVKVLDEEDDVASVQIGGKWRMPTETEFHELRTKCSSETTTLNGIEGLKVIGPNGNSIFFPFSGSWWNGRLYGFYRGDYWSSTVSGNTSTNAIHLTVGDGFITYGLSGRNCGLPIRPVYAE